MTDSKDDGKPDNVVTLVPNSPDMMWLVDAIDKAAASAPSSIASFNLVLERQEMFMLRDFIRAANGKGD